MTHLRPACPTRNALRLLPLATAAALLAAAPAHADTGKLLLTGGVSSVEGAAGGGISPWAVIGSQATEGELGVSAYASRAVTRDYGLSAYGVAVGIHNRLELSLGRQDFNTGITGAGLGLPGLHLKQDIVGAKLRVAGDAVLDSDSLMPQIAVGVQFKHLQSTGLDGTLDALGAKRHGTDVYVSATKLFLAQGILVNATLRATQANQGGLLGFGARLGGADNGHELQPEISVAYLISSKLAVGVEYRGPGRRPARRRLDGPLHRLGAEQEPVSHRRLRGSGPHRARHHPQPPPERCLPLGPDRFLSAPPLHGLNTPP